ncbi:hypothetical protein [Arthrobacter sp. Soil764]|uniref:hypothetical protein n=1 Tax=Arthrobacter sp. Soil764 TaxID=1736403 RepID=UPI001F29B0F8|nr:hypothetical protein [Arthrobacter sp. Soil764]
MTAVLEPQAPEQLMRAESNVELPFQSAGEMVPDVPAAPFHCGAPMTAGPVPIASLGWAPLELGSDQWSCACGHTVDDGPAGDPLEAVRLASARVESLQWELDAAQERFGSVLRSAAELGAGRDALSRAAGLTVEELEDVLRTGVQLL